MFAHDIPPGLKGKCRYFDTSLLFLKGAGKKNQGFKEKQALEAELDIL
jgi:hypothetical protein